MGPSVLLRASMEGFLHVPAGIAEREPNRIARRRCIFASFGALLLARLVSCFAKSHQNLSKMHSPTGASSFDAADFFESKSFSRRAYRQYVQGKRCRNRRNLHVKTNLVRLPFGYGRAAPIVRNKQIVEYADEVIAFWDRRSKGTLSVIQYCKKTNTPCVIIAMNCE